MAVGSRHRSLAAHTAMINVVKGHQKAHQAAAAAEEASCCDRMVPIRCAAMIQVLQAWAQESAALRRATLAGHFRLHHQLQPLVESFLIAPGVHSDLRLLQRKQVARHRCPAALPVQVLA